MKKILILIAMSLCLQIIGAEKKIECRYDMGGYDDEFIYAVADGQTVRELVYVPYYGDGGEFKMISERLFQKFEPGVVFSTIISFSDDFKNATLMTVYLKGTHAFYSKHFSCVEK
ncbi:MAG: hypothetical protein A2381_16890 [Bdellovibrionales bacterium RIFOXYB1_FULL_37_110]|nr:MAG: hypothetical protein A2181_07895 [Bdellovibrionales bacterium RIFOXYA1_FULL_38_20]OFZ50075.1 MAG: hypothetical protein A2417_18725 [Bdellovibrionales bacterium RIFOXYC1_FULL_37_79]OFZ59981.1 MAG: hypothetical protein A2381_16890 [Bdellovibrionales bacterium RIFOXYB1_FULL_37_110]OFZ63952.1 MAG: hypothetical protein A2577_06080 [Bdellovibrionales bacterium RIFOXYD1_FULL_36_51]